VALAATLAGAEPRPALIQLDRVTDRSPWPEQLRSAWPGGRRPTLARSHPTPAPALRLDHDDFESWFASKSSNFRQQMRRSRRRIESLGGRFRLSTEQDLVRDVGAFARLHRSRWEHRGGSDSMNDRVQRMLVQAGQELAHLGRFRLWCLDVAGETVSAHLFISAGDEVAYWLGGFDERFAKEHPGVITLVVAIEDALARGERRVDLGSGGQHYKYRLANSEETLQLASLVPPGPLEPVARGELAARRMARALLRRRPRA
jgi:CelD/BcsL family acetyltransferase involved in cellulose biosynthesis